MKKVLSFVFVLAILFSFSLITQAAEINYIDDTANLLTYEEQNNLNAKAEYLFSQYGVDVAIHTTMSTYGEDIDSYAQNYYSENDYAKDGVLFVINLNNNEEGNRDFYTYCEGAVYETFAFDAYDSEYGYVIENVFPYLKSGDYYNAFFEYMTLTEGYLSGEISYLTTEEWLSTNDTKSIVVGEIIAVAVGLIIAFAVTYIMKKQMNTAEVKIEASDYVTPGSLKLTRSMDIFTYRHVTKTAKPKNNTNSGGGFSSGGKSGGSGGKF